MQASLYSEWVNVVISSGDLPTLLEIWKQSLDLGKTGSTIRDAIARMVPEIAQMNALIADSFQECVKRYDERNYRIVVEHFQLGKFGALFSKLRGKDGKSIACGLARALRECPLENAEFLGKFAYYIFALSVQRSFIEELLTTPAKFVTRRQLDMEIRNRMFFLCFGTKEEKYARYSEEIKNQSLFVDAYPSNTILKGFLQEATDQSDLTTLLQFFYCEQELQKRETGRYPVGSFVGLLELIEEANEEGDFDAVLYVDKRLKQDEFGGIFDSRFTSASLLQGMLREDLARRYCEQ